MTKHWQTQSMTWGKRLIIAALIVAAIGYAVLGLAERSPDALRQGLEDYISKLSGHRGEITDLSEAKLRPDVRFKMQGVNIRDRDDRDKTYLHADSILVDIPFVKMMFGSASYKALEVRGLDVGTGFILPKKLHLDYAGIADPTPQTASPQFIAEGDYNGNKLLFTMEMIRKQAGKDILYAFADQSLTSFKLGKTELEGLVVRHFSRVSLDSASVQREGLSAQFSADNIEAWPLNSSIQGTMNGLKFNALLTKDDDNITLKVMPESRDKTELEALRKLIEAVLMDMGLADDTAKIHVDITGLPDNQQQPEPPAAKEDQ